MDVTPVEDAERRQATLSLILKSIRRRRGFRSVEVARLMGTSHRSYQRFEAGEMGSDAERIHRFADMVDADGWAIILGVEIGSADFAIHCMDNKACRTLLVALRRYNLQSGRDIARLDPRSLFIVFSRAFEQISVRAREFEADLEEWMFDAALNGDPDDDPEPGAR